MRRSGSHANDGFPHGRSRMIAGAMLGLGRALGETVAVLIILRSAAEAGAGHCSTVDIRLPRTHRGGGFNSPVATGLISRPGCILSGEFRRQRRPRRLRVGGRRVTDHLVAGQGAHFPSGQFGPQFGTGSRRCCSRRRFLIALGITGLGALYTVVRRGFAAIIVIRGGRIRLPVFCPSSSPVQGLPRLMDRWCGR